MKSASKNCMFQLMPTILSRFFQPLLPGEKRQKEEWENPFVYGMGFNFLLILLIAFFKPDTRWVLWSVVLLHYVTVDCSMSAWAHEQAMRKLEAEEAAAQPAASD